VHFPLSEGISNLLSSSLDYDTFDEYITSVTLRINANSSTKVPMRSPSPLSIMLFATILATVAAATLSMNPLVLAQNNSSNASVTTTQPNATVKIQAGGGNSTIPYDAFYPKQIQISPGQIVSWYNAAKVGEPHTVTFVTDNKTKAPFAVKNSSSFVAMPPDSNLITKPSESIHDHDSCIKRESI
jgi:plastocyanin